MKKRWEEPKIGVQKFVPNEYVAACGDTEYGNYLFECNAPGGRLYYYTRNWWGEEEAEYIGNYSPCSKKHEASRESEFPDGFVDYNRNGREDAAKARVYALKREMGEELFEQYVRQALKYVQYSKSETARDRHMSCMAGRCSFTVNWQGEMRPCVVMNEPSISVFEVGFEKAWEYISEVTSKILLNEKCSFCCMRHLCRTCAAFALLETGSYDGVPEYMCRLLRKAYSPEKIGEQGERWQSFVGCGYAAVTAVI